MKTKKKATVTIPKEEYLFLLKCKDVVCCLIHSVVEKGLIEKKNE